MTQVATAGHLVFDGALTMRSAEALCSALQAAMAQQTDILIDCSAATEADLSFVQLLLATRVSAVQANRRVALSGPPDGALLDTLTRGGFRASREGETGEAQIHWFEGGAA